MHGMVTSNCDSIQCSITEEP